MRTLPKVMLAHCIGRGAISTNCYTGVVNTITSYRGPLQIEISDIPWLPWARNELVSRFFRSECDYILFLDSDIGLPKNGLKTLVSHNLPIVCGLYNFRTPPHPPCLLQKKEKLSEEVYAYEPMQKYPEGLIEVDAAGCGCLLIKRNVFESLAEPYFFIPDVTPYKKGEDIYFFEKAKKKYYRIYADTTVKCTHMSEIIIDESLWIKN